MDLNIFCLTRHYNLFLLQETIRLNTLDLSHNQFGDGSGHIFGHTIGMSAKTNDNVNQ